MLGMVHNGLQQDYTDAGWCRIASQVFPTRELLNSLASEPSEELPQQENHWRLELSWSNEHRLPVE